MKTITIALIIFCFMFMVTETKAQETLPFSDGGNLYTHELKEVIGTKKIKEWQKDSIVSISEFKITLTTRGVYVMPNYAQETVERFLIDEYGSRIFLIMNENVSVIPYLYYKTTDGYGIDYWERFFLVNGIPTSMLNRVVIAGRSK